MTDQLTNLEAMVAAALANEAAPTSEWIRELIGTLRQLPLFDGIDESSAELLARRFEEKVSVKQTIGSVLTERGHRPWLNAAREHIDPYYWDRYRRHLIQQGLPQSVVTTLDQVTDRILGLLQNPLTHGNWDRRGMVMGHVQSGKTSNYTGLICKAADAGYKLIVVIAGVHNNLRNQTQRRIDEGFVGRDSARLLLKQADMFVGVGNFDHRRRPVTFTNTSHDFNKAMATGVGLPLQNLTEPAVFVIKKHSSTLRNLIEWLREHSATGGGSTIDEPMLLIDDEADNASINIRHGSGEVSRINGQIRELLQIFSRSCYVGYTATPFANIFIDPDTDGEMLGEDLFPRSFIVSLDPPSNYFGASSVFLENWDRHIRHIDDNDDYLPMRHPQHIAISSLPTSLEDALRTFVVSRAIRLLRGQERQHSSMLVNASRFMNVQSQLRNEIHARLDALKGSCRVYGALPAAEALGDAEIQALHHVWAREFSETEFDWDQVHSRLHQAASPITVVEVNSKSSGTLDYTDNQKDGLNVIAVGGFSLSRGLTLEGLTVSYFLRNSMMYDTLMQMGRWFGYRPGYEDLCRIWMPEEAQGWYEHIAESIEELRGELRNMQASNATPADFGLKVRSHPDTLIVTARNKMGTGERVVVNLGLSGKLVETHTLSRDSTSLRVNREAARRFVDRLEQRGFPLKSAKEVDFGLLIPEAPVGPILEFLKEFRGHETSPLAYGDPIRLYIEDKAVGEFSKWDVLVARVRGGQDSRVDDLLGVPIHCQQRTEGKRSDERVLWIGNRNRVSGRGIEKSGLGCTERADAEEWYRRQLEAEGKPTGGQIAYPDRAYRMKRTRPLLAIHLIEMTSLKEFSEPAEPVVAWSISFPYSQVPEKTVRYMVNTTWMRENFRMDVEEEEMQGDEH